MSYCRCCNQDSGGGGSGVVGVDTCGCSCTGCSGVASNYILAGLSGWTYVQGGGNTAAFLSWADFEPLPPTVGDRTLNCPDGGGKVPQLMSYALNPSNRTVGGGNRIPSSDNTHNMATIYRMVYHDNWYDDTIRYKMSITHYRNLATAFRLERWHYQNLTLPGAPIVPPLGQGNIELRLGCPNASVVADVPVTFDMHLVAKVTEVGTGNLIDYTDTVIETFNSNDIINQANGWTSRAAQGTYRYYDIGPTDYTYTVPEANQTLTLFAYWSNTPQQMQTPVLDIVQQVTWGATSFKYYVNGAQISNAEAQDLYRVGHCIKPSASMTTWRKYNYVTLASGHCATGITNPGGYDMADPYYRNTINSPISYFEIVRLTCSSSGATRPGVRTTDVYDGFRHHSCSHYVDCDKLTNLLETEDILNINFKQYGMIGGQDTGFVSINSTPIYDYILSSYQNNTFITDCDNDTNGEGGFTYTFPNNANTIYFPDGYGLISEFNMTYRTDGSYVASDCGVIHKRLRLSFTSTALPHDIILPTLSSMNITNLDGTTWSGQLANGSEYAIFSATGVQGAFDIKLEYNKGVNTYNFYGYCPENGIGVALLKHNADGQIYSKTAYISCF